MESGSRSSACHSIRRDGTVVSPSEDGLLLFHRQKTDSADRIREGIVRGMRGDMEYSPNILRNSPTVRIHDIRGMEPLVQDVQPVSSSEYSHVGQSVTQSFY